MSRAKRVFSPEFREDAVRLVIDSSRPIASVARELQIGEGPLGTAIYVRDPSGGLLTWRTATTKRAHLTDRRGSVIAVVNTADGSVDRRYTYDPYGVTTKTNNTEQYDNNPWRYTGAYQDNTTGLYKLGASYYQPTLGRFTQTDPSGREANTYLYTGGNPINDGRPIGTRLWHQSWAQCVAVNRRRGWRWDRGNGCNSGRDGSRHRRGRRGRHCGHLSGRFLRDRRQLGVHVEHQREHRPIRHHQ